MKYPLNGEYRITQDFYTWSLWYPQWGFYHRGIDWACPTGTNVNAVASGKIIKVGYGYNNGWGNQVIIKHSDGLESWYNHLSVIFVIEGQLVSEGDCLAKSGNTGFSFGAHLDFRFKRNGQWVNPLDYFNNKPLSEIDLFLKNNNMDTIDDLKKDLAKDFVKKDKRSRQDMRDGSIWLVAKKKKYKIGQKKNLAGDVALIASLLGASKLTREERGFKTVQDKKKVL